MKKHINYIDTLRLVASAFVVFMHTASGALNHDVAGHTGWYLLTAVTGIAFTAVPLFFMVSGYLLTSGEQTASVPLLLKKRLPKLIVPLLFWSAVLIVYQLLTERNLTAGAFLERMLSAFQKPANVAYWFLYALIGMYLISPVLCVGLKKLDRTGERFLLALISLSYLRSILLILFPDFAARYLQFRVLDYLAFFDSHLSAFILGWFLGKTEKKVPFFVLIPTALLTFAAIVAGTFVRSAAAGTFQEAFLSQSRGFEVLLAVCLFLIIKQAKLPKWWEKLAAFVAPHTFSVYLTHNICLTVLHSYRTFYSASATILCAVCVYLFCLALALLCSKIPVLSYLATGQKCSRPPLRKSKS